MQEELFFFFMKQYQKIIMRKNGTLLVQAPVIKHLLPLVMTLKDVSTEDKALANVIPAAVDLKPV